MNLISAENVRIEMGARTLLEESSFGIQSGERIALVGLNGCGKTTLISMITGADTPNGGAVIRNSDMTMHCVRQKPDFDPVLTVAEYIFSANTPVAAALRKYEACCWSLKAHPSDTAQKEFEHLTHELDRLDAWGYEGEIRAILSAFGIENMEQTIGTLSGGMAKKIMLAQAIIENPDLLILDEPTNHLDIDTIVWLQWYLTRRNGALLMVTHDRYFLDAVCTGIWEIDNRKLFSYEGNYTKFLEKKTERMEAALRHDHKQSRILAHELEWARKAPRARSTKQQARLDRVAELMNRETIREESTAQMSVSGRRLGKKIIDVKNVSFAFDNKKIVTDFSYSFKQNERLGLVGNNGAGKTTLLNLLTGRIAPQTGIVDPGINTHFGIFDQHSSELDPEMPMLKYMKSIAEVIKLDDGTTLTASDMLDRFLFPPSMQYTKIGLLSGGEKRRLHLLAVLMSNPNFLILDEPTNDLDIQTLTVLEEFLNSFAGCLIVVSHDRFFLDKVVDYLFVLDGSGSVKGFPGNCTDWLEWKKLQERETEVARKAEKEAALPVAPSSAPAQKKKLSFKEKQEYDGILDVIAKLEEEKELLEALFSDSSIDPGVMREKTIRYNEVSALIDERMRRWEELAEIAG